MGSLMTYRESETWLQRHQEILNKSVSLLEMHPKLIQLRCCDRLWDYISKVSVVSYEEDSTRFKGVSLNTIEESKRPGNLQIPEISVSDSDVQHVAEKPSVKKVYVCGIHADSKWHRLIIGLCLKFFVRCGGGASDRDDSNVLDEIDVVLFILNEQTVNKPEHVKLLTTALNSGKHVLFLRLEDYILPKNLPQAEYDIAEQPENLNTIQNDDKISTGIMSGSQMTLVDDSRPSSNMSQGLRPDSGIGLLSGRQSICSVDCKDPANKTEIPVDENLAPIIDPSENSQLFTKASSFQNLDNSTPDLSYVFRSGYKKAFVYNTDNHATFLEILKTNIEQYSNEHLNNIMVNSNTDQNLNTNTIETADQTDVIETFNKSRPRRESVDTVFVICSSDPTPGVEPRIVRYPKDLYKMNIPLSSSMESFGFQDVDLSKTLNDTDWFTPEELAEFD